MADAYSESFSLSAFLSCSDVSSDQFENRRPETVFISFSVVVLSGRTDVWVIITESVLGRSGETAVYCRRTASEKLRSPKSSGAHIFEIAKDIPIGHSFSESWSPAAASNRFGLWSNFLHRFDCPKMSHCERREPVRKDHSGQVLHTTVRRSSIESKVSLFCIAIRPFLSANIENDGKEQQSQHFSPSHSGISFTCYAIEMISLPISSRIIS